MRKTIAFILTVGVFVIGLRCSSNEEDNGLTFAQQFSIDSAAIEQYLLDNNITNALFDPDSLVRYILLRDGEGTFSPSKNQCVRVNYSGRFFPDGDVFDADTLASFYVDGVISGWTIVLQQLQQGDSIRLFVPSGLAYGSAGRGSSIPANAILEFNMGIDKIGTYISNNSKQCEL
jgi:FKBP-type peptidyl-prolyl cis-trans isomerase